MSSVTSAFGTFRTVPAYRDSTAVEGQADMGRTPVIRQPLTQSGLGNVPHIGAHQSSAVADEQLGRGLHCMSAPTWNVEIRRSLNSDLFHSTCENSAVNAPPIRRQRTEGKREKGMTAACPHAPSARNTSRALGLVLPAA